MPGLLPTPPVGDLYGPFWALEFYASAASLNTSKVDVRRTSARTGEALVMNPNILVQAGRDITNVRVAGGSEQTLADLQNVLDDFDLSVYKSEMTVTLMSESSQFELSLSPPYDEALKILDNRVIQRSIYVIVEWGYIGEAGDIVTSGKYAFMANRPSMSFSGTDITIQLAGQDVLSHSLSGVARKEAHDRRNGDITILDKFAKELGYDLDAEAVKLANKQGVHPLFETNREPLKLEQDIDDWSFFKKVLRDNGCAMVVGPGDPKQGRDNRPTIYVFDKKSALRTRKCDYTLRAYQQMQGEFDVPILSFESQPNPGIFSSILSKSVDGRQANLAKGETEQETHDMSSDPKFTTTKKGRTGAGAQKDARKVKTTAGTLKGSVGTPTKGATTMSGPSRDSKFMERLNNLVFDQSAFANVLANVTVPGLVGLSSDMNVNVRGLGKSMSGVYRAIKVEHRLGGSGYETTASLIRYHLTEEHIDDVKKARGPKIDEAQQCEFTKFTKPRKLEGSN